MPDIFSATDTTSPKRSASSDIREEPLIATEEVEEPSTDPVSTPKRGPGRNVDDYSRIMQAEAPSTNPLHAFAAKPANTSFDSQNHEEEVLLLLRQHPVTQIKWILIAIILIFVPYLLSYIGFLSFLPARFQEVAAVGWYLMVVGFAMEAFLDWFYNVYIITDERVIDVDFVSLLFKNVSFAKIDRIEDVSATTAGTLGAIFDYGTVQIQTAGAANEFEFTNIPHPSRVMAFLNDMMVEEEREKIEGRAT
jgi:hypothetical protein